MITFLVLNYLLLFTARHAVLPDSMDEYKLPVHDSTILLQWSVFTNTTFYTKRVDTLGGLDIAFPKFTDEQKKLKGKTVALKCYVIPLMNEDEKIMIILSKFPNSSCFFCGAAGPESVVQVNLKQNRKAYKTDQIVIFKGKLLLNDQDLNQLNFILDQAEIMN